MVRQSGGEATTEAGTDLERMGDDASPLWVMPTGMRGWWCVDHQSAAHDVDDQTGFTQCRCNEFVAAVEFDHDTGSVTTHLVDVPAANDDTVRDDHDMIADAFDLFEQVR